MATHHRNDNLASEVFSIDLKGMWFALRLYRTFLCLCILGSVSLASVYIAFFRPDSYRAEVVLKMAASPPSSALSTLLASLNASEGSAAKLEALNELLGSSEFGQALIRRAQRNKEFFLPFTSSEHLHPVYANNGNAELDDALNEPVARALTNNLQFRTDMKASTLSISAWAPKPWLASQLAELAGEAVIDLNYQRKLKQILALKKFMAKQLKDTGEKLNAYENDLAQRQKANGFIAEEGTANPVLVRYNKVQEDLEEVKRLLATNADRIKMHDRDMNEFRSHLNDPAFYKSNVYLTQLQYRMRTLAYQLDLAKSESSDANALSEVDGIKNELSRLGNTYRDALNKSSEGKTLPVASPTEYFQDLEKGMGTLQKERTLLQARYSRAQSELKNIKVEAERLPDRLRDVSSLKRNITLASTIYLETEKKLQEVQFMEAETVNDLSLLTHAKVPEDTDNLSLSRLYMIMAFLGFFFGSVVVLYFEVFGQIIHTKKDLEKTCDRVLGIVPKIEVQEDRSTEVKPTIKYFKESLIRKTVYPTNLVLEKSPDGPDADNFRSLRMHLFKLLKEESAFESESCKVIMVTSPGENSGRTFMAANLALTLAKAEMRILLIDLDLRNPDLFEFFPNCTPAAVEQSFHEGLDKHIQHYSHYLDVILLRGTAHHPPEVLESHEIKEFFKRAREKYDLVIFDSSAVLHAVDPAISSALADLVIMTVEAEKTKRDELSGAIRKIRSCNTRPIYGVLNFADRRRDAAIS